MNNGIRLLFLILFMALLLAIFLSIQYLREPNEAAIFVTGDLEGYLIPCGCRTSPAGGLSRRIPILEKIKSEKPNAKIIPVELPNLYMDRNPSKDLINKFFGDFLFRNNYFVALGERDISFKEKLKEYYKGDYFIGGVQGYKSEEIVELGGYKGLPLGKKGRLHLLFLSELSDKKDLPIKILDEKAQEFPQDAFVVFGNLSPQTVEKLLSKKIEILGIFATWGNTVTSLPQKAKNSWVVYLGDKGRRFAKFDISYYEGKWDSWPETGYIDKDLPFDKSEEDKIEKVLKEVDSINEEILNNTAKKFEGKSDYVGSLYCKTCHKEEYEKWEKTRHFSATKVLEIDHQEKNPECLICHTTAFGKGGFPDKSKDFSGIGCEACHGAGKTHPPSKMKIEKSIQFCLECHTKRDSPFFNEGYFQLIEHSSKTKFKGTR
ncbi:MAG: cytochrome c family protein [Acidobacteria bacterium]|nr:cytochrome c family protein [Acidobacteriota bacterium]